MDWNPGAPDALGLQFAPRARDSATTPLPAISLASTAVAAVQTVRSTVTETIEEVSVFLSEQTAGKMLWEALVSGSEIRSGYGSQVFRPDAAPTITSVETELGSTVEADIVAAINEPTLDESTWITATGTVGNPTPTGILDLSFPTGAALTGKRILEIVAHVVIGRDPDSNNATVAVALAPPVGLQSGWGSGTANVFEFVEAAISSGELNQTTEQPWTVDDVQQLDGGTYAVRLFGFTPGVFVYQAWIEVFYCDENRVARGAFDIDPALLTGNPYWVTFTPEDPDGVANWSKVNGTDVTSVLRRPVTNAALPAGSSGAPYIAGIAAQPLAAAGVVNYGGAVVNADGSLSSLGLPVTNRLIGLTLATGAAQSVDSQPYIRVLDVEVSTDVFPPEQEIAGAVGTYAAAVVPVAVAAGAGDLTVDLVRRSDAVVMATGSLSAADALALPLDEAGNWRVAAIVFDTPVVLAAVQYALVFSTTSGAWYLPGLSNRAFPFLPWVTETGSGGEATYGGETDILTLDGVAHTWGDLSALVVALPDPVTGLAVTGDSIDTGASGECPVDGIGYVQASWDATGLGVDFRHYELQRRDERTDTWQTIMLTTDETFTAFADVEARLGVESCYRVRVVRDSDGVASLWSDEECATAPVDRCELTFTSNEANDMSVAYHDVYDRVAEREYEFPEADEVLVRQLYGRDYQVAFHPLERRGVTFTRRLLLAGLVSGGAVGPPVADELRDLAVAELSYVCVRDSDGNRWYGSIRVPALTVRQPGAFHWAQLIFIETTATPSTPEGELPVPGPPVPMLFMSGDPFLFMSGDQMMSVSS